MAPMAENFRMSDKYLLNMGNATASDGLSPCETKSSAPVPLTKITKWSFTVVVQLRKSHIVLFGM